MRILVLIAVFSMSCGYDSASNETREITTKEETKYETRQECHYETQCRNVRIKKRRRGKWDHPHYRRSCDRVQVCEDVIYPVSI